MITLHKFIPAWGLPDLSPFCIKVETYLRMAGLEYRTVVADSRKAPKQKCPYIEHDGVVISDSSAIVSYLESKLTQPLDQGLDARQRAVSTAFKSMLEEHLYFVLLWIRWIDPEGWDAYRPVIYEYGSKLGVPSFVAPLLGRFIRRGVMKTVWAQGMGRHSPDEIRTTAIGHLRAISAWMDKQDFMLGPVPHTIDATVYSFLCFIFWSPYDAVIKAEAERLGNLRPYCERMKARYWAGTGNSE